jgi:hypothetical protein
LEIDVDAEMAMRRAEAVHEAEVMRALSPEAGDQFDGYVALFDKIVSLIDSMEVLRHALEAGSHDEKK